MAGERTKKGLCVLKGLSWGAVASSLCSTGMQSKDKGLDSVPSQILAQHEENHSKRLNLPKVELLACEVMRIPLLKAFKPRLDC